MTRVPQFEKHCSTNVTAVKVHRCARVRSANSTSFWQPSNWGWGRYFWRIKVLIIPRRTIARAQVENDKLAFFIANVYNDNRNDYDDFMWGWRTVVWNDKSNDVRVWYESHSSCTRIASKQISIKTRLYFLHSNVLPRIYLDAASCRHNIMYIPPRRRFLIDSDVKF